MTGAEREERFTALVFAHGDLIARYLRRRFVTADAVDVEDLLSDVMATAWRRLDDIPEGMELPWLYGVARRRIANARSRSSRRDRLGAPLRPRQAEASAEDFALADLGLQAAMQRLSEKEREVLTLTAWEGLAPDALAIALGISVNAAAVRLSKAKAHLLSLLDVPDPKESPLPVATQTS